LGIGSLPDDQKLRILEQSAKLVEGRTMVRLMNSLPEDKRDQLNGIIASNKMEDLKQFIDKEAPDYEKWLIEEAKELKEELLSLGEPEV
jgi:hypothetical protein